MTIIRILLASLFGLLPLSAIAQKTLTICADPGPPPWTYWVTDSKGKPTSEFKGSSVDLFRAVFSRLGYEVRFIGDMPWARCMHSVENRTVDFAMDAYYNVERATRFDYSVHYNTLTPRIFYRRNKPLVIKELADLKKHRGCGMNGASYTHYGLAAGDLEQGGSSYERMILKLKAERCDYFVEELEVIAGYKTLGRDYLKDPDLLHAAVPGATGPAKHLIAAKSSAAAALLPSVNELIEKAIRSGEAAELWKRHTPDLPYKP